MKLRTQALVVLVWLSGLSAGIAGFRIDRQQPIAEVGALAGGLILLGIATVPVWLAYLIGTRWKNQVHDALEQISRGPVPSGTYRTIAKLALRYPAALFALAWLTTAMPVGYGTWGLIAYIEHEKASVVGKVSCAVKRATREQYDQIGVWLDCRGPELTADEWVYLPGDKWTAQFAPERADVVVHAGRLGTKWIDGETAELRAAPIR